MQVAEVESTSFVALQSASELFFFFVSFGLSLYQVPLWSSSPNLRISCCNGHYRL